MLKRTAVCMVCVVSFGILALSLAGSAKQEVVMYDQYVIGYERDSMDRTLSSFAKHYPEVKVVENPVPGGPGELLRGTVSSMIEAGYPPDIFQIMYGPGQLSPYLRVLAPLDEVWEDFNVSDVVRDLGTFEGHPYAVPLIIQRTNCLWYNKKIVEETGIPMPLKSLEDLYVACAKIKSAGYIPYAIGAGAGEQVWLAHVFEYFVLAVPDGGPEYLFRLYKQEANPATDSAIRQALEGMQKMFANGYVNVDFSSIPFDQAAGLLMRDEAAFFQMGDWGKGLFTVPGWKPKVDFDYQPSPGTGGLFILHGDSWVMPEDAPNKTAALKWLKFLTTTEAGSAFCPGQGSPVRLDAPITDMYDVIAKDIISDLNDPDIRIFPSCWAQPPACWLDSMGSALGEFATNLDIEAAIENIAWEYETQIFPSK